MSSKNLLVTTKHKNLKEGINDMRTKPTVVKEVITPPVAKNNPYTVKKQRNHKHL